MQTSFLYLKVHVPRVLIMATPSQNGGNDRKLLTGGQRMQNPLPSAPIIIQPPSSSIALKTAAIQQSANDAMRKPTEPSMIHPQAMVSVNTNPIDAAGAADPTVGHSRQQVMVIQSANLSNATQDIGNCQTMTVAGSFVYFSNRSGKI